MALRRLLVLAFTFLTALAVGWSTAPQTASCRMCNSKKCFFNADCGRLCACIFEGGKKGTKKGVCVQVGD